MPNERMCSVTCCSANVATMAFVVVVMLEVPKFMGGQTTHLLTYMAFTVVMFDVRKFMGDQTTHLLTYSPYYGPRKYT